MSRYKSLLDFVKGLKESNLPLSKRNEEAL